MSLDRYFGRRYSPANYNCAHFVAEVWQDLTGTDLTQALQGFLCRPSARRARHTALRQLRVLERPQDPCIVFMQGPHESHVGVWIRGRVLHLLEDSRVHYVPLEIARLGFNKVRFLDVAR